MVGAAGLQPAVQAGADAGGRLEVEIRHLDMRHLAGIEHLALGHHQPVVLAHDRRQRHQRAGAGLGLEQHRRRVVQTADAERPVDQPRPPVAPRDLPVAFAHMALQRAIPREVHGVHLGEMRVRGDAEAGGHQAGAGGVAFGGVAVALGHQVGRRHHVDLLEAAVEPDRVEIDAPAVIPVVGQELVDGGLEAGGIAVAVVRQRRIDVEVLPVLGDHRVDLGLAGGLHQPVDDADVHMVDLRPQPPHEGGVVGQDVAHAGHLADGAHAHPLEVARRPGGVAEIADEGAEPLRPPILRDDRAGDAHAQDGVGGVLGAVDALVVGQVRHVPVVGDRRQRLDVGQHDRQRVRHQRADGAQRRAIGQHHDDDAVDVAVRKALHVAFDVVPVPRRAGEHHLGDRGQRVADFARIGLLALGDARQHVVVQLLHDAEQAQAGAAVGGRHGLPPKWSADLGQVCP